MFTEDELNKMAKEFADKQAFRIFTAQAEEIYNGLQRGFKSGARKVIEMMPKLPRKEHKLKLFRGWSISLKKD